MDPFIIFLIVIITIITTILIVTGIQVILLLRHVNKTLLRVNQTLDFADHLLHNLANPLTDLKALGHGVKTGLHVAEHIVSWVKQKTSTSSSESNHE